MKIRLKIWRQASINVTGHFEEYKLDNVDPDMSFLEMLDTLNDKLICEGRDPVSFDHDCREGICGACSIVINGIPHGKEALTTTCQLHMRKFNDNDFLVVEPWRALPFPVIKDLVVDRSALDKIITSGGYISANTGQACDAKNILIPKDSAEEAMDAASCIGCGACVASCRNASATLFVGAKISQFALLPQGHPERAKRVREMAHAADGLGFGHCSNEYECEAVCPKGIKRSHMARYNREFLTANLVSEK
jgi:succinate dehydrogenase / fumarate reductase iron-sulfur subunit